MVKKGEPDFGSPFLFELLPASFQTHPILDETFFPERNLTIWAAVSDTANTVSRHLKNRFSPSRKSAKTLFLESICDFASLRELHFWDYSEVSVLLLIAAE